ncbi:MAG: redoxin domain-containing protein [Pirellulales bacterium]
MGKHVWWLTTVVAVLLGGTTLAAEQASPIGKKVAPFSARDFRGKLTSLDDLAGKRLVVVAFLGTECPLAKLYAPRLAELARQYQDREVAFLGINSNQQDSITELAHYASEYKIEFPLLKDVGNAIADQFAAVRTPEIFVLDADRTVRYFGRIDDQFGFQGNGIAYQRNEPRRRDLAVALDELLAGQPVSQAVCANQGCHIGRVKKPLADSEITYSKHIAPIFNDNCVYCHRPGQIAPFPLTNYEESVGWAEMVREVTSLRRMPPWHADPKVGHFRNDARLSDQEIELINRWVDSGAPQGDPKDLPPAPVFATGWQIPQPDEVVYMAEKPYDVAASGTIEYQRFTVDPGWTEDKWVQALECVPGNPAVVHHIIVYLIPPGVTPTGQAGRLRSNWLGAFAPGLRQEPLPEGYARFVQKGTKLLFEMHYTANGTPQQDRSYAGFVFADPQTVKKEVAVQNAGNFSFQIPPGDPNYEVESEFVFRQNTLLLSMAPHMHVRGKDFRYDVIYPDGKTETLLWIPGYDFGWQTSYELAEPKLLPRGTKMHCVAHFDNSPDNMANPDPTREVAWGEQTWEEMMFGWFEMALADQDLTQPASAQALRAKEFLTQADSIELDSELQAQARTALESDKAFDRFTWQLMDLIPQLDRVCVTCVEKDKLRLKMLNERLGLRTSLRSTTTVVRADGQSLAEYALGNATVVNQEMGGTSGSVMAGMAKKDIRSSMHVPVEIAGVRCTVNFWSAEPEAFPPQAVRLLEQAARLMADGTVVAQK